MRRSLQRISVKKGTWLAICSEQKTALVRVDDKVFTRFGIDDFIVVASGDRSCTCKIIAIRRYNTLENVLKAEDLSCIAHGSEQRARVYLSQIYKRTSPTHRFVVLQLELVKIGRRIVN